MKKYYITKIQLLLIFSLCLFSIESDTVYDINDDVTDNINYKKVEFSGESKILNYYFKHSVRTIPSSRINAFRFEFDQFSEQAKKRNIILCTFVDESTTDEQLIEEVRLIDSSTSSCVGAFNDNGIYDGIIEFHKTKKKLAIWLVSHGQINFTARVYLKTVEKILSVNEQTVYEDESFSLVPYTIIISHFRDLASKILFYSYTRELQMYYVEEETSYPERIFFGNILSVYTNPNMVRQKYHNADTMVLLTKQFGEEELIGEQYKFQVKFFASNFLLDYYMSNNLTGRSKNTPLAINMTECENPYYVILNYNQPEKEVSLYIDEIYGKIKSLAVAPELSRDSWEEMIENDMQNIQSTTRKFVLPKNSSSHLDVYKIECDVPLLLNFYYIDEDASIPDLDYGYVAITTLKAFKSISLPFAQGIHLPELTIEIFNPIKVPLVIVDDGQNEQMISKNSVIKSMPFNTNNPIVVKERNGDSDTRIIIKIGYSTGNWKEITENIVYESTLNMYVFSFPNNESKLNYTYALLETSGSNDEDNVKYCYGTNIGSAILPSKENCYRVSKDNSYTIKVLNPRVMFKEYAISDELNYYVSLRPTLTTDSMEIKVNLVTYDTIERNFEGKGNTLILNNGKESTILSSPEDKDEYIIVQIHSCDNSKINFGIYNAYDTSKQIVENTEVPSETKHYYNKFKNIFLETELKMTGNSLSKIFVKHSGVTNTYTPNIKDSYPLTFNQELNQLIVENPLKTSERMSYTILIGKKGELSSKGITLCSFTESIEHLADYISTYISFNEKSTLNINFNKIDLKKGDIFEAIAFIEQQSNSQMVFLTDIFTGTVGEIETKSINEIKSIYEIDTDYVYTSQIAESDQLVYYFSYLPTETFDVPVGAFRIELDTDTTGSLSGVSCAFVNEEDDASSMVEAVEDVVIKYNSYCTGGKSKTNGRIYNYMFKYSYTKDEIPKPRRLVIKVSNGGYASGGFKIYIRKGVNTYLEPTDFNEQKEYGRQEEYKMSIIPYILDLEKLRGNSQTDYVSKILIYSQHLEMQMYFIDSTEESNSPILLFTGNIMLVYTKLDLAQQKYHATKLILLSENINGQEHSAVGNQYRFHTKMFKSSAQIEYFISNNPSGRTLNFPLSAEMNICTSTNNKYYYILNYNQAEGERILYLDLIFGSLKRARIANEINAEKWDSLIQDSMTEINNYQINLIEKSQHIDVVEIECNTPLLANIYYNYEGQIYSGLSRGDIVVKTLNEKETFSFTLTGSSVNFYYSISAFNFIENPNIIFTYDGKNSHQINENSLQVGLLFKMPYNVFVVNNGNSPTRFIFKIGYGVESEWIDEGEKIEGKLFSYNSAYVYRFPLGDNKRNFTNVVLDIKPMRKDSQEEEANVKFCYSTSMGTAIDTSLENCFRTGANIPYSLTFINPLIAPKNYKAYSNYYYVTLSPYNPNEYISLVITENKYNTKERNIEGVNKIIKLETSEKSTILSIPEIITNTYIFVQLEACKAQFNQINYVNKNAYTGDVIQTGTTTVGDRFFYYTIENNLMETEVEFTGCPNDEVFVKHTGITDYKLVLQDYSATFDSSENVVNIIKPIKDESFKLTVLVGEKSDFDNYTLCTFAEKKESDYSELADYAKTFTSVSSNNIIHFIDFRSFSYTEGKEFDLLVYAVQINNAKLEILYDVISGVVGKIQGITEITGRIDDNYVTQEFQQNKSSNYLFYDFKRTPIGNVASLKIINNNEEGMKVSKVGCVFVYKNTEDVDMVRDVNNAIINGTSVCIGETQKDSNGFDALINAIDVKNGRSRLVIQVIYGMAENSEKDDNNISDTINLNINIRINGFNVDLQDTPYNEKEEYTLIPYVLDLEKIRGDSETDYVSKIMVYSNTREMQMFYLDISGVPIELFSGNIMLVFTNKEVVQEKYHGANIMILLTNSLSRTETVIIGEQFRFKAYFFKSDNTMQYYVSANPEGRLLNNPTSIEMLSCDKPYYYILNYHFPEGDRILHIDNIYGEINTIKFANELDKNDWYELVKSMKEFKGNEYIIKAQTKFHMDIIEVTCKIPSLLNIYYTDNENPKIQYLDQGDISILDLGPADSQILTFISGLQGEFIYSFSIIEENEKPNILVTFEDGETITINKNGIYTKNSNKNYGYLNIENIDRSGSTKTKVIFKFGYNIESIFTKIQNDVYNLQTEDRLANLFAYKFKTGEDRLNYTSIDFRVSTSLLNVKFCYTTNLGAFIDPSLQNCYRVGRGNSYTISVLNPYLMYKNYYTSEEVLDYYVSFRTEEIVQNITITPTLNKYKTQKRNTENYPNSFSINNEASTILTPPKDHNNYLFVQMHVCTPDESITYEFNNAYNSSSLNENGEIQANTKNNFRNIHNIKLETELLLKAKNSAKIFIKHSGVDERYQPTVKEIGITFDKVKNFILTQPIENERFKYTIYLDKRDNLKKHNYTLCSFTEISKLAHYTTSVISDEKNVTISIDFNQNNLKDYKTFEVLVLAEGIDNGKIMILSDIHEDEVYEHEEDNNPPPQEEPSNLALVIVLIVLAILLVAGALIAFILLRRYKLKPNREKLDAKETSLAMVDNKEQAMMASSATQNNE